MSCTKRRYPTRIAATRSADRFERRGGDKTRPYLCLDCECWHLTHLELWKVLRGSDATRQRFLKQCEREILLDDIADLRKRLDQIAERIKAE